MLKRLLVILVIKFLIGCGSVDFATSENSIAPQTGGEASQFGDGAQSGDNPSRASDNEFGEDDRINIDAGNSSNSQGGNGRSEDDANDSDDDGDIDIDIDGVDDEIVIDDGVVRQLNQDCWFAVSGTYLGFTGGGSASTFPDTQNGREIESGSTHDNSGGVFLNAREEPYIDGDGEIDQAVTQTFDSIVVAAGMRVIIENANGGEIFSGEGPFIAISDANYSGWSNTANSALSTLKSRDIPSWLRDILPAKASGFERLALTTARSVQVATIEGSTCDPLSIH
jgi:hypothetical protein